MIPRRRAHTEADELAELKARCRAPAQENPETIAQWERAVRDHVGAPHAAVVNSGRRGMTLIFEHLGIGAGDEVVVPAYTLKDLIPLIQSLGATVVPADVDPDTFNVSPDAIARRITPKTRAILALHAFGAPCAIEQIVALADGQGIPVIEDCAHSLGATVGGRQTGSFGRAAFFSFETTKPVNTYGGGMVVSSDEGLVETVRAGRADEAADTGIVAQKVGAIGTERLLFTTGLGFPLLYLLASPTWKGFVSRQYRRFQHAPPARARYLTLQAEVGLKKLATLSDRIRDRKGKVQLLRSLLSPDIRTQQVVDGCESSWYMFVAVLPREAVRVRRSLLLRGIDAGIEDEIADNCAALLGYDDCPAIDEVFGRTMALPLYEGISEEAIRKIARVLNKVVS